MTIDSDAERRTATERLLDPLSIVVVGASSRPGKRGYQAIRSLQEAGFAGGVYAVNPHGGEVLGVPMYAEISALPVGIDVALVAVPAAVVPGVIRELARVHVGAAVVLANGFRESGSSGAGVEAELGAAIAETGVRVIGPNTSGMLDTAAGVNLVGVADVPTGPVSVVTQSGNMLLSLLADARARVLPGLHRYIGLGNQIDIGYHDILPALASDHRTRAIAVHMEGLGNGRAFLIATAEVVERCPVVILRGGRSEVGRSTAISHTGSVAGSDAVATAVLRQAGAELVDRSDEFGVVTGVLATCPPIPYDRGLAVLSDGGGHAALAADALTAAGVALAGLGEATRATLRSLLGPAANVNNPIDVAGATDANPTLFAEAARVLLDDAGVGAVMIVGLFGGYHLRFDSRLREAEEHTAHELTRLAASAARPIIVHSCYAVDQPANHRILREGGIPVVGSIDHAVRATAALSRRGVRLATATERSRLRLPARVLPAARQSAPRAGRVLDEPAARQLLDAAGLSTGPWCFADSKAKARTAVAEFACACALKVVSAQVTHKSEVGGVRLHIDAENAENAYTSIVDTVSAAVPHAVVEGVIVTPMAEPGVELLVGVTVDPIFGPVVAFGSGGVLVEALGDVTFRAAPLTRLEAHEMMAETIADRLLDGYRHLPPTDREELASFLVDVGKVAANTPGLVELDLNPVIAAAHGPTPVDVRVVVADDNRKRN